jgi:hypothetical protein
MRSGGRVSFDAIKTKAPIDLLDDVVSGLEGVRDPAKRAAAVVDLFGKSGARLLPLLSEGPEGLAKLRAEVGELGASFDSAFLDNAQEVNDNVDRLKLGLRGLAIQVIGPMLPDLVELSHNAIDIAKSFIGWIKQINITRSLVTGLAVGAIPLLTRGLASLGAFALEVVAPFLVLDDALTFLAGGDSLIGRGLEKAFGAGTGDMVRKWCEQAGEAIRSTFVGALDLLRIAFSDTDEASKKLWQHFELLTRPVESTLDSIVDKAKLVFEALTDIDTLVTGLHDFGEALAAPFLSDEEKQAIALSAANRHRYQATGSSDEVAAGSVDVGAQVHELYGKQAPDPLFAGLPRDYTTAPPPQAAAAAPAPVPAGGYAAAFQMATAPAPPIGYTTNTTTNNVAPVTNVTVNVQGDADVGNRVAKAAENGATRGALRAAKAALVPTPG